MRQRKPNARPRKQVTNNRVDGTERIIIVAILILALALLGFIGVYAYQNFLPSRGFHSGGGFSGGGGGGSIDEPSSSAEEPAPGDFELIASEETILLTETDTVYFYADLGESGKEPVLYEVSSDEDWSMDMFDDGNYSAHGDDIAGDGIYSAKVSGFEQKDAKYTYVAKAGDLSSNEVILKCYTPISEETLAKIDSVNQEIEQLITSAEYQANDESKKAAALSLLQDLAQKGLIVEDSIHFNEESYMYTFEYAEGVIGSIQIKEFDPELNGSDSASEKYVIDERQLFNDDPQIEQPYDFKLSFGGFDRALILNAFPSFEKEAEMIQYRTGFYQELKKEWEKEGINVTLGTDVTVSDFKNLGSYDLICISTHGTTYEWKWYDIDTWNASKRPALTLTEKAIKNKCLQYSVELKDKQLVVSNGRFWILPEFFKYSYKKNGLNETFVFTESCQSMGKEGSVDTHMADAFISRSAAAVVGYHNSVLSGYSRDFMKAYIDLLNEGTEVNEALDKTKQTVGSNDKGDPAAYPILTVNYNAQSTEPGIKNGGFEQYDMSAEMPIVSWEGSGDVRALSQLGEIVPAGNNSNRMAVISTGIGSKMTATLGKGTEGSRIYQKFTVPENATTLSFDYNYISEEPMEYVGSVFNDSFCARITYGDTAVFDQTYESINGSEWQPVQGVDFTEGDETAYQTGWKSGQIDVSEYRGKKITISFIVYDQGDSIYDSACAIDNVRLE